MRKYIKSKKPISWILSIFHIRKMLMFLYTLFPFPVNLTATLPISGYLQEKQFISLNYACSETKSSACGSDVGHTILMIDLIEVFAFYLLIYCFFAFDYRKRYYTLRAFEEPRNTVGTIVIMYADFSIFKQ